MKKLLLIVFLTTIFLFLPRKEVLAQCTDPRGCYSCQWIITTRGRVCYAVNATCTSGYEPNWAYCGNIMMNPSPPPLEEQCESPSTQFLPCVTVGSGTVKTADQKIFCDNSGNPTVNAASGKIYTAIGCIPYQEPQDMVAFVLKWAMGVAGGIGLILIIVAGYQMMTSAGNPQKLNAGKELLTASIMGIALLIFGVYVLKLIGVDILNLPGF